MKKLFRAKGHDWIERNVTLAGETILQRQCKLCRRNFVLQNIEEGWRAVEVGALEFKPLDEETNALWLSEHCPA
jgi:hypothetical protein